MTRMGWICGLVFGGLYVPGVAAGDVHQPSTVIPVKEEADSGFFREDLPPRPGSFGSPFADLAPVQPAKPRYFRSVRVIEAPSEVAPVPTRAPFYRQLPLGAGDIPDTTSDVPPTGSAPPPPISGPVGSYPSTPIGSGYDGLDCLPCEVSRGGGCQRCRGGRIKSCLECRGWDLGGWLSWGNTLNDHGNHTSDGNAPLGFNNYADGYLLNQAWIHAAKEADTGGCGWDWGFRVDFMFGADGPDTQAFGDGSWDAGWDTGGEYGFAMPQLYGEVAYHDLKVKIGHFYTIIGYEVVQAPDNFFYSHAYTFYYGEPFTHTGFLAEYGWSDNVTLYGGWTGGWDGGFENRHGGSTFLGGIRWAQRDDRAFTYATTFGDRGFGADTYMQSIVADVALTHRTSYVFQTDWQTTDFGAGYENAYGLNQYLIHAINDCSTVAARVEWFRDDSGNYVGNGPGDYWETTFGWNYAWSHHLTLRPELRWDWFDGGGRPFDDNTKRSQFTLGFNGVYVF